MSIQERNLERQGADGAAIKRQRTSEAHERMQTTKLGSAVVKFKLPCEQIKSVPPGQAVHSDPISTGGHMWRINCFPSSGTQTQSDGVYLGIFLELLSNYGSVSAKFEASLTNNDGEELSAWSSVSGDKGVHLFRRGNDKFGWPRAIYARAGKMITFVCSIVVLHDNGILVPPSDLRKNLGMLLDSTEGSDVSFTVDGETFHAHRAVLAARSPVFKAELLGSMAEATMASIPLLDIAPETFRVMLRFMYTEAFPGDDELEDSPSKMLQNLLAAAGRYGLDRLKLICAHKLWDTMSVDTVADLLACAEVYSCPELKDKCLDFVVADQNFKKVVLTEGFMQLGQTFPSIIAEVRRRIGA